MLFDDGFLERIKADPTAGAIEAIESAQSLYGQSQGWTIDDHEVLVELMALLQEMESAGMISVDYYVPDLSGKLESDCSAISGYVAEALKQIYAVRRLKDMDSARTRFRVSLGNVFAYEFSQGDLDRIQKLVNELREHISAADYFEAEHQQRLLKRLEKLQAEMHKKVADLDRFWGLLGDAGVALGKFGEDAKPIFDRVREMTQIVWRTQARSEELPSGTSAPSLEDHSSDARSGIDV